MVGQRGQGDQARKKGVNRVHWATLRNGDKEQIQAAWDHYTHLNHWTQCLVQQRMAEANLNQLQTIGQFRRL